MLTLALTLLALLISFIFLFIFFGFFLYIFDAFLELPYVATKKKTVEAIMELANIKDNETVIDLGSGDGRLLFTSADRGAFAIGYELNPMLVIMTIVRAKMKGVSDKITVYKSSLWKADLERGDVIFVYARQGTMQRMQDFVYQNAKKGSRVVVNTDLTRPFPQKKPLKVKNGAYLYKV